MLNGSCGRKMASFWCFVAARSHGSLPFDIRQSFVNCARTKVTCDSCTFVFCDTLTLSLRVLQSRLPLAVV